ncbi:MAG: NifB/NifX family molybdenum-iron cluster-binding protein [Candidatus Omnitrophica bacterium]|nr:NifB/NifX family molybdenum-iron cluster-binding protein [Candidatus Omnitrophota bacterium]
MKICIPTETNQGKKAQVYGHFGSAPFFTIYDTANDMLEVIDNANEHHSHGMCQPMAALSGKGVNAVVTGGAGSRAVQKLNEGGIKVYRAVAGTVADIVAQVASGKLEEISVENACSQHGCH